MVRLRSLEKQLKEKQNELDSKQSELQQMEDRLYDPLVIPFGASAQHDVNFWSEQEVYLWIMQLKCTGMYVLLFNGDVPILTCTFFSLSTD